MAVGEKGRYEVVRDAVEVKDVEVEGFGAERLARSLWSLMIFFQRSFSTSPGSASFSLDNKTVFPLLSCQDYYAAITSLPSSAEDPTKTLDTVSSIELFIPVPRPGLSTTAVEQSG